MGASPLPLPPPALHCCPALAGCGAVTQKGLLVTVSLPLCLCTAVSVHKQQLAVLMAF